MHRTHSHGTTSSSYRAHIQPSHSSPATTITILCRSPASQQQADAHEHACGAERTESAQHTVTSRNTEHCTHTGQQTIPASCKTRHPGTADAEHRHARAGLGERNGPNLAASREKAAERQR